VIKTNHDYVGAGSRNQEALMAGRRKDVHVQSRERGEKGRVNGTNVQGSRKFRLKGGRIGTRGERSKFWSRGLEEGAGWHS